MRLVLFLVILAAAFVGFRVLVAKYTGPGDDILIPEGSTPSWRR
jgi:hypothetical protein